MGWVHPSGLGGQNAAVGIEDTGSPPHPRRFVQVRKFFRSLTQRARARAQASGHPSERSPRRPAALRRATDTLSRDASNEERRWRP